MIIEKKDGAGEQRGDGARTHAWLAIDAFGQRESGNTREFKLEAARLLNDCCIATNLRKSWGQSKVRKGFCPFSAFLIKEAPHKVCLTLCSDRLHPHALSDSISNLAR